MLQYSKMWKIKIHIWSQKSFYFELLFYECFCHIVEDIFVTKTTDFIYNDMCKGFLTV